MDQKTTVNFQGLSLTKETVEEMDLDAIQKLKSDASNSKWEHVIMLAFAGGAIYSSMLKTATAFSDQDIDVLSNIVVPTVLCGLAAFNLSAIRACDNKVSELDAMEDIKTASMDMTTGESAREKPYETALKNG